jgi:hypothetical protein
MKNSTLFLILISLLGVTYYWQEYRPQKKKLEEKLHSRAINLQNFFRIELPHMTLKKSDEGIRIENILFPLSVGKVNEFITSMDKIKVVTEMDVDFNDEKAIKEMLGEKPLSFTVRSPEAETKYTLGQKPALTGRFYILREKYYQKKMLLCEDDSHFEHVYSTEEEVKLKKFYHFYNLISYKPLELIEKKIFPENYFSKLETMEVKNNRNRYFLLNFFTQTTVPTSLKGIDYNDSYFRKYIEDMKALELKAIHEKRNELKDLVSELVLNKEKSIKLFKKHMDKEGYFISFPDSPFVFEIESYQADLFFHNVQDFWKKKLSFLEPVKKLDGLDFDMSFFSVGKTNKYNIEIIDDEYFKIVIDGRPELEPVMNKFMNLIKVLFGMDKFISAERVSTYTSDFLEANKRYREFRIEIFGKKLDFYQMNKELVVANVTDGHILHFSNTEKIIFGNNEEAFFESGY